MSLFDPLRNYCERTGDMLWSEPINAITNIAFFIAAWVLYKTYRKTQRADKQTVALIILIAVVGAGSTLFHTFANRLTMLMDIIPIAIFTLFYLWVALRRLVRLSTLKTAGCLLLFAFIASQMSHVPYEFRLNGSIDYFPCLAALLIIGFILQKYRHPSAHWLFKAALCFVVSLTFRSIDFMVCPSIAIGTHFLWHSFNGLMLYLLTRAVIGVR
jgi:hypothetical protein